ncbi:hypothetical protein ACEWY4_019848 [Coilia grayii]|uniref:C2H2-type domain-containing protein n=1 Tax=Coilia grayii TaxID=363190 RepID=A0ABD1JDA3_9TELE
MHEHLKRKHTGSVEDVSAKKKTPNINMAALWRSDIQGQQIMSTTWSILNQTQPTPVFCVACATKFPNKRSLEDHECPAVSYICTCGTGFKDYLEMLVHRNGHPDTSSFHTDHVSIMKHKEKDTELHELKLRMLKSIDEKLQQAQARSLLVPPVSPALMSKQLLAPPTSSGLPVKIRITPPVSSSDQSLPSAIAYKTSSKTRTSTALPVQPRDLVLPRSGVTVNLSARFQPAVLLNTKNKFNRGYRYMCETCRVVFWERKLLLEHVASHFPTHIYGCQHCGLLLISSTPPSSTHFCGSYQASRGERFTKGQCIGDVATIGQKRHGPTRCPYCPSIFYQPWYLNRHIKSAHSSRDVPCLPQSEIDKAIIDSLPETAMASVTLGSRMSDEPVKKTPGHKMINGMVNRTVALLDEKRPEPTTEDVMKASHAVLEIIKQVTKGSVAEGREMKVAQKLKEDLQQHGAKTNPNSKKDSGSMQMCNLWQES